MWGIVCDHDDEATDCDEDCWCGHFYGYTIKLLAYTGIITWLPIILLGWIPSLHELLRKKHGKM